MRHVSSPSAVGSIPDRRWSHSVPTTKDPIKDILELYKTLVVVGLSAKPSRPSHGVAAYMRARGYRVIPVNPNENLIFGEKAYSSLEDIPGAVDVVVVFRKSELVPEVVEAAIRKGAKVIWMQEGVAHEGAARQAREAGVEVIQDRCILKEYAKRFVARGM